MTSSGGGLINLYFHPCEFIHSQFWDMNFAHGANPPREQWRTYPLRPPGSREHAFSYFEQLVRYMKSFPQVQFITGPQATRLYADGASGYRFSASELAEIARQVESDVNFQVRGTYTLSPAEVMTLVAEWMASQPGPDSRAALPFIVYGPSLPSPRLTELVEVHGRSSSATCMTCTSSFSAITKFPTQSSWVVNLWHPRPFSSPWRRSRARARMAAPHREK
jgi:hypothetical protein